MIILLALLVQRLVYESCRGGGGVPVVRSADLTPLCGARRARRSRLELCAHPTAIAPVSILCIVAE